MIRVTFDRDYVDNLEDYYRRNECIREQQYLSQEKLLHLAAFCISKVAGNVNKDGEAHRNGPMAEAALDAIRQLSLLCQEADQAGARIEPVTIVNGQTEVERQKHEQHTTPSATLTFIENGRCRLVHSRTAKGSIMRAVAGWFNLQRQTPRS